MPGPVQKVSFLLNGGVDEQSMDELTGPVAAQGSSPTLKRSTNTRLSLRRGTCIRAPEVVARGELDDVIHTVIPCSTGKNTLVLCRPGTNQILDQDGATDAEAPYLGAGGLRTQINNTAVSPSAAGSFLHAQIVSAGAGPGEPGSGRTSSVFNPTDSAGGPLLYHAYVIEDGLYSVDVVVYVTTADGAMVATPRRVLTGISAYSPTGVFLTAHGESGVRMWLTGAAGTDTTGPVMYSISRPDSNAVTVTPIVFDISAYDPLVLHSAVSGLVVDQAGAADITHGDYAYLAMTRDNADNCLIVRVNVNTTASSFFNPAGANVDIDGTASVCFSKTPSGFVVGASFVGNDTIYGYLLTSGLGVLGEGDVSVTADFAATACQLLISGTDEQLLILSSFEADDLHQTLVLTVRDGDTALTPLETIPWMRLHSTGAQFRFASDEAYPTFDLVRYYGFAASILDADYVSDPDVQLWMWRSAAAGARCPIARYGVVRGSAGPAVNNFFYGNGPVFMGDTMYCHYLKLSGNSDGRAAARWVSLRFPKTQPAITFDRDGSAITAGAIPLQWDGSMPTELGGPLYIPHLIIEDDPAAGIPWPTGDYILAAIYTWMDASGQKHRSAVAQTDFTASGTNAPIVTVTAPVATMRDGIYDIDVTCSLYSSLSTDTTLRLLTSQADRSNSAFLFEPSAPATEGSAVLYSSGELGSEQQPQPPCPLWDVTIVGDRLFGIDAEYRSRIVYSKRRVSGVGYEWHPAYEILLPSGSGDAEAVLEWQGSVVVLTKYGIFGISGDGPDNLIGNPSGGSFSRPQKIADIGSTDRASVVATAKGIVFQRGSDFLLYAGGAPTVIGYMASGAAGCLGAVHLPDANEVVFFYALEQRVWNYEMNRWTTWTVTEANLVQTLPYDRNRALLVTGSAVSTLESEEQSTTRLMSWETDWLILTGDFQDHIILQAVVYSGRSTATHTMSVDVYTNYSDTPTTERAVSTTVAANADGRYTIKVAPRDNATRAVKLVVSEDSIGTIPVCVSLYYTVESAFHDAALPPGAFV